jgi:hypothetical protein
VLQKNISKIPFYENDHKMPICGLSTLSSFDCVCTLSTWNLGLNFAKISHKLKMKTSYGGKRKHGIKLVFLHKGPSKGVSSSILDLPYLCIDCCSYSSLNSYVD